MSVFKELGVIVDSHLKIRFIKQSESQQNKHTLAFKGELITLVDSHKHRILHFHRFIKQYPALFRDVVPFHFLELSPCFSQINPITFLSQSQVSRSVSNFLVRLCSHNCLIKSNTDLRAAPIKGGESVTLTPQQTNCKQEVRHASYCRQWSHVALGSATAGWLEKGSELCGG